MEKQLRGHLYPLWKEVKQDMGDEKRVEYEMLEAIYEKGVTVSL